MSHVSAVLLARAADLVAGAVRGVHPERLLRRRSQVDCLHLGEAAHRAVALHVHQVHRADVFGRDEKGLLDVALVDAGALQPRVVLGGAGATCAGAASGAGRGILRGLLGRGQGLGSRRFGVGQRDGRRSRLVQAQGDGGVVSRNRRGDAGQQCASQQGAGFSQGSEFHGYSPITNGWFFEAKELSCKHDYPRTPRCAGLSPHTLSLAF